MKMSHFIAIVWIGGLLHELMTNDEHIRHAEEDSSCWVWRLSIVSIVGVIAYLLRERHRHFARLGDGGTPAPAAPLRRDLPRPAPPPMTITPVPAERYVFVATNDPSVDLQPKGRGPGA